MKTEVYSWRLDPELKRALERIARGEGRSLAELLERIAKAWLSGRSTSGSDDDAAQRRLHAAARSAVGRVDGGDSRRAERARDLVRARLRSRRAT